MANNYRREQPPGAGANQVLMWSAIGLVAAALAIVDGAAALGNRITGTKVPSDPWKLFFGVLSGDVPWPLASTLIASLILAVVLGLGVVAWRMRSARAKRATRVDDKAALMGTGRDIESITEKAAMSTAQRLGVTSGPGIPIGITVHGNTALFGSWEDMHIDIWGPRSGKTTSRAINAILAAPGPVLVTSNKRDIVDATRDVRAATSPVWIFDPQSIAGQSSEDWWWNPLTYVTDEVKAATLAGHFAAASRPAGARTDAYFDTAGQNLLAGFLLAAAIGGKPITQIYKWLSDPTNDDAIEILKCTDYDLILAQLEGILFAPDKQQAGVYGTAQQLVACLTNRQIAGWITTTGQGDDRPEFDPHAFVREGGTLYSLSKEGVGTAGPLVTALTVAVVEAAEELASKSRGGRLPVPLVGVLDEAANVCRWSALPDLYSHYGSRGIVLMTILQSWSQGLGVWGPEGMKKLWSASNVKVFGGGVDEVDFLSSMSQVIGQYDKVHRSVSSDAKSQRNITTDIRRESILEVSDLAAMPRGRAVVFSSGNRPTMARPQPWMNGPYAEQIRASILAHDPAPAQALSQAEQEVQDALADLETQDA